MIIGGRLAKPAFAFEFGEDLATTVMSSFTSSHCNDVEKVTNWEDLGSADALRPCLQNHTAKQGFQQTTDGLSLKSCFPTKCTWLVLCFCLLKLLSVEIAIDLLISLSSVLN